MTDSILLHRQVLLIGLRAFQKNPSLLRAKGELLVEERTGLGGIQNRTGWHSRAPISWFSSFAVTDSLPLGTLFNF